MASKFFPEKTSPCPGNFPNMFLLPQPSLSTFYNFDQGCQSHPTEKILDCRLLHFLIDWIVDRIASVFIDWIVGRIASILIDWIVDWIASVNFQRFFSIVCFLKLYIFPRSNASALEQYRSHVLCTSIYCRHIRYTKCSIVPVYCGPRMWAAHCLEEDK